MEATALFYSLVSVAFASQSSRGGALGILVLATLIWPDYLRFPIAGIQMSPTRLIALMLIYKYRHKDRKKDDKFNSIDKMVVAEFLWDIFANTMAGAETAYIKERIGRSLDTIVIYFAARFTMRDKSDLEDMIKPLLIAGIIMGFAGAYEAVTYHSPYQYFLKYNTMLWIQKDLEFRAGFLRAQVSGSHPIYFGMSMFIISGILLSLRGIAKKSPKIRSHKLLWAMGLFGCILAGLASLSSGPMLSIILLLVFNVFCFRPALIQLAVRGLLVLMVGVELFSHRHFYHLIDYVALDKGNAYYRTRLMEVAVNQVHEYWLFGLGGVSPVHWGMLVDGRSHVDIVNNYVIVAIAGGLPLLFIFVRIQILSLKRAILFWKTDEDLKIFGFGLACLILSFMLGTLSVSIFGPTLIFSYMVYGILSSPLDIKK